MNPTYSSKLIKSGKEFIQRHDQLLSSTLGSETGKTFNVCEEDAVGKRARKRRGEADIVQLKILFNSF